MPTTATGKYVMCSRCHGTGEARYNHLNGDTHCYVCNGVGMVYRASAAEKAREAARKALLRTTLADPKVQRRMAQARVDQLERDAAAAASTGTVEVRGMGTAGVQAELARAREALAQVAA